MHRYSLTRLLAAFCGLGVLLFVIAAKLPDEQKRSQADSYSTLTLLYATNRDSQNLAGRREAYGPARSKFVSFGKAEVTVPLSHQIGQVELPQSSILEERLRMPRRPRDLGAEFGLSSVTPTDASAFAASIKSQIASDQSGDIFIYVPGRRESFNETAYRTAQLAYDLKITPHPIFFSWPARATMEEGLNWYIYDSESASTAEPHISSLLEMLGSMQSRRIVIISNGLGSRSVLDAFFALSAKTKTWELGGNLVFIHPDIGTEKFAAELPQIIGAFPAIHITVYSDPSNLEGRIATAFMSMTPVGSAAGGKIPTTGFDFIVHDSSPNTVRATYAVSPLIQDLYALITKTAAPSDRKLQRMGSKGFYYWKLENQ